MRVLVTRPEEDAREIAAHLESLGHQAITAPLMSVRFHDGPEIDIAGFQAILATSANGVRALAKRTRGRNRPVFAVGPQTAEAARRAKFATVRSADGDATALVQATERWADPAKGMLLHPTTGQGERPLAAKLEAKGFSVKTLALYDIVPARELPPRAAYTLRQDEADAALFFSPRSAETFRSCVLAAGLQSHCAILVAVAISKATAAALAPLKFREIRIAAAPNQEALLACLG